ncbi:MAG TPA: hypothetical protein VF911_17640 [Thermoanaerobaculia bacterium]
MKKPDRALHEIARRAMKVHAHGTPATPSAAAEAMQLSCGDLYRILETAMGPGGLNALLSRAIQLTAREYPWLAQVKPGATSDCALQGLPDSAEDFEASEAAEGYAALLATIMWLLMSFIGEDLTLRFVRHAWPKLSFSKLSEDSANE